MSQLASLPSLGGAPANQFPPNLTGSLKAGLHAPPPHAPFFLGVVVGGADGVGLEYRVFGFL